MTPTRSQNHSRSPLKALFAVLIFSALLPALAAAQVIVAPPFGQTLPAGWAVSDVGSALLPGYAAHENDRFTVAGAGSGIDGAADQFTFAYRLIAGDVTIIARVDGLPYTMHGAQAAVMIRQGLSAGSKHAAVTATIAEGVAFRRRKTTDGATVANAARVSAPVWLRLDRRGSTVTASWSSNGTAWTTLGTDTVSMSNVLYVGLGVSSRLLVAPTKITFSSVQTPSLIEYGGPLPTGWGSQDIGGPRQPGAAAYDTGTFGVRGGGTDIGGTWDQFRFAHASSNGDVDIVARVRDLGNTSGQSKAGVMIRDSLTPNGAHASMIVTASGATLFRRRVGGGSATTDTPGPPTQAPVWLKLSLRDGVVTASQSNDGVAWTVVGTQALTLPQPFQVGLAVSSANDAGTVTANVDNVSVTVVADPNTPPTVTLTEPANGTTVTAPGTITVSAAASDTDGTVSRVDFYQGTTLIGTDTTSPYSVTWSNVPAGTYSVTARATDDDGATATSAAASVTVNPPANQSPAVSLSEPANGATFTAPANITVSANASDTDGTVARVDFYQGTTLIGSDTTSPYSVAWNNVAAGTYSLTARAIDDDGATATSAAHTVTVNPPANQPASVALTAPANGATFTAPANITVSANASDTDGSVARVDFYQGTTLIGSDTTSPYSVAWNNVAAGTYSLTARAIDDDGATATSAAHTVTVNAPANQPPTVGLTAPANGASFTAPASITITASASDTDGTIARVDFYQGATLIGSDTTSPYSVQWNNVAAGTYSLTARAIDDDGATATSAARTVTVNPPAASQRNAVFNASPDHGSLVSSYLLQIFAAGADPGTANPIASQNLGKPTPVNGEITADVTATINALNPGNYQATVSAVGSGGSTRSGPATFTR